MLRGGPRMADQDKELEAMSTIMAALSDLEDVERSRVLEYVLKRLDMATVRAPIPTRETSPESRPTASGPRAVVDIRSLKEEKNPQSANEMAALVAYYLSELAPVETRTETIDSDAIRHYFKEAGFRLPSVLRNVLPNAASAGYLQNVSYGKYRLNPVGYNLVVHGLPRTKGSGTRDRKRQRRKPARPGRTSNSGNRKKTKDR
jgi:hypothetical protein